MQLLPPSDYKLLPDKFVHRNIETEAWRLMRQGRLAYTELPTAFNSHRMKADRNRWRWCTDSMDDIIETVRRQVLRRQRIKRDQHVRESGLGAAATAAASKTEEQYAAYYKRLGKSAGFKYLRFSGWNQKNDETAGNGEIDNRSDAGTINTRLSGTHALADIESVLPHRYITVLSTATNLKYLHMAEAEMQRLAYALRTDDLITDIILANGNLSDLSVSKICPSIPTMTALIHLDLSGNAVTDDGCMAIADACVKSRFLQRLVLSGNRIHAKGAELLVRAFCQSVTGNYLK
jgi:hypothetical protein